MLSVFTPNFPVVDDSSFLVGDPILRSRTSMWRRWVVWIRCSCNGSASRLAIGWTLLPYRGHSVPQTLPNRYRRLLFSPWKHPESGIETPLKGFIRDDIEWPYWSQFPPSVWYQWSPGHNPGEGRGLARIYRAHTLRNNNGITHHSCRQSPGCRYQVRRSG